MVHFETSTTLNQSVVHDTLLPFDDTPKLTNDENLASKVIKTQI